MTKDFGKRMSDRMKQLNPGNLRSAHGIAWYRPETYERCLAIFQDADDLPDTYDEWLVQAEEGEEQLKREGLKVVRAEIDPVAFPGWCANEGYAQIDTHARIAFANAMALDFLRKKRG